jgi:GH15 family glucan-1,4-alpha-glucosidase
VAPAHTSRRYLEDTLVLETEFETDSGTVRLTDFMPTEQQHSTLVRILRGLRGHVTMRSQMQLNFDYGSTLPWLEVHDKRAVARVGPDLAVLYSPIGLHRDGSTVVCEFELRESEEHAFALVYGSGFEPAPPPIDSHKALAKTKDHWRNWIKRFDKKTEWFRAGSPFADYTKRHDLPPQRRRYCRAYDIPSRATRRRFQLGLSVLLDSRRCIHLDGTDRCRLP